MHVLLTTFRTGAHSLPVVLSHRMGTPRAERFCQQCDQHAVGDECKMMFECPALLPARIALHGGMVHNQKER